MFIWQLPAEAFPDFKEPMNCHLTHGLLGPTAGDVHLVYFHPERVNDFLITYVCVIMCAYIHTVRK